MPKAWSRFATETDDLHFNFCPMASRDLGKATILVLYFSERQ
jgi:hypothetical protein